MSLQIPHPLLRRWKRCSVVFQRATDAVTASCRDVTDVDDLSEHELSKLLRDAR